MQVLTVRRLRAKAVFHVKLALGHLLQVVLVQKLAIQALFTQTTQPMFAHDFVEKRRCEVFVGTRVASRTSIELEETSAERPVGVQAELVLSLEIWREFEP